MFFIIDLICCIGEILEWIELSSMFVCVVTIQVRCRRSKTRSSYLLT